MNIVRVILCDDALREAELEHTLRVTKLTMSLEEEVKRIVKEPDAKRRAEEAKAYYDQSLRNLISVYNAKCDSIRKEYGFEG